MRIVIKEYGRFLLEAIAVLSLAMMFVQQGYFQLAGPKMPIMTEDYSEYIDFREHYYWECQKDAPKILYVKGNIATGSYLLGELIEAYDYQERALEVKVHSILTPQMEEKTPDYGEETIYIDFEDAGIYTIKVSATDDGNRQTICTIKIPVNKRKDEA